MKEAADQDQMAEIQKKLDKSAFEKTEHPMSAEVKVNFCKYHLHVNFSLIIKYF